jgi:hypothetical protein
MISNKTIPTSWNNFNVSHHFYISIKIVLLPFMEKMGKIRQILNEKNLHHNFRN